MPAGLQIDCSPVAMSVANYDVDGLQDNQAQPSVPPIGPDLTAILETNRAHSIIR